MIRSIARRWPVCLGLALLLLSGCARSGPQAKKESPAEVGVVELAEGPVALTTELPGRAVPFETSEVRPQVGGVIVSRPFKEGSDVRAGDILYRINPEPFQAAFEQAKAQLASAQASVAAAKAKSDRYAGLVEVNGVARQEYDDAVAVYRQAVASVAQQKAALDAARVNLGWTAIRAPIAGRVGVSNLTEGALVVPGQTTALTTIQRLDPIYVNLTEPAVDVLKLRQAVENGQVSKSGDGVPVRLKLEDGTEYPLAGRLQFTDVTVNQATDGVTLKAIFPNPKGVLLPGMFVEAEVAEGVEPRGLLAPEQGVQRNEKGEPTALVVGRTGKVEFRALKTGPEIGNQWLIADGLKPGDRLIVEGAQRVKPGDAVLARPAHLTLVR